MPSCNSFVHLRRLRVSKKTHHVKIACQYLLFYKVLYRVRHLWSVHHINNKHAEAVVSKTSSYEYSSINHQSLIQISIKIVQWSKNVQALFQGRVLREKKHQWLSTKLLNLQCVSKGGSAVMHWTFDIHICVFSIFSPKLRCHHEIKHFVVQGNDPSFQHNYLADSVAADLLMTEGDQHISNQYIYLVILEEANLSTSMATILSKTSNWPNKWNGSYSYRWILASSPMRVHCTSHQS